MSLETAQYINQLNPLNPDGSVDLVSTADDHLRLIKSTIQNSFPNITGPVLANQEELTINQLLQDTGAVNAIVVTPNPAWTSYSTGKGFTFKAANSITSLTPTIKVNGLAPIVVLNADGSLPQIKANGYYTVRYDGTNFRIFGQSSNDLIQGDVNIKGATSDAVITNYSTGNLILKTNNTEAMRIQSTGYVGIGATPTKNSLTLDTDRNLSWKWANGNDYANMFNQASSASLILASGYQKSSTTNGFASSIPVSWAKSAIEVGGSGISLYTNPATTIAVGTDITPTERVKITSAGNVGIGVNTPSTILEVKDNSQVMTETRLSSSGDLTTTGMAAVRFGGTNDSTSGFAGFYGNSTLGLFNKLNGPIALSTNNTERVRIIADGKVGIGTATPTEALTVTGNIKATGNISADGTILVSTPAVGDDTTKVATTEFVHINATRPKIDQMSQYGWNSMLFLSEGKVYEAHGSDGSLAQATSGRGLTGVVYPVSMECITQVIIPDASPIVKISGGHYGYAAALTASGNLYTWGNNTNGECGLGHTTAVGLPTFVMSNVADLYDNINPSSYAYNRRNFIKKTDGTVWGCGYNGNGGLGIGNIIDQSTFVQITAAGTNPKYVGNLGGQYGCLIIQKSDNTIWGAGYNYMGVLGTGAFTPSPYYIASLTNVTTNWNGGDNTMVIKQIAGGFGFYDSGANSSGNIIMLLDNGTSSLVKTCGWNTYGSIGNGGTGNVATPNTVSSITGRIIKIGSAGGGVSSVYALNSTGTLYGWGWNNYGQLANGNSTQQNSPITITTGVSDFYLGEPQNTYQYYSQLFVKKTDGFVYSAGYNGYAALGVGDITNRTTLALVRLPYIGNDSWKFGSFSTSGSTTSIVAVSPSNTIYTWGHNGNYGVSYNYSNNVTAPIIFELKRGD